MKLNTEIKQQSSLPDPLKPASSQETKMLFAMCLFGEARGESALAQQAVANVIMNRARFPHSVFGSRKNASFEENLRSVILHPQQFSSLNPSDPNYAKLFSPLDHETPETWTRCVQCAETTLASMDAADTLTLNSDHYFDDSIQPPVWAHPTKQTVKIGRFNFYRLYLPPFDARSGVSASKSPSDERRMASAPPAQPQVQSVEVSSEKASGSCLTATGSTTERGPRAQTLGAVPAPENSLLRPPASLTAPKSPSAHFSGPRPYLRYEWSRRLSPLFAVLVLCLVLAGCSDFERAAYNVLAVTQTEYETIQQHMAEAAVDGRISNDQWNRFEIEGHRFIAAHNATIDAFAVWSATKSGDNTAKLQTMLDSLPKLILEINDLVRSFSEQTTGSGKGAPSVTPDPANI
jgi:hypothetical protein